MPQGIGVCGNVQPMFLVYHARQVRDVFGKLFACEEFSSSIFASSPLPFTARGVRWGLSDQRGNCSIGSGPSEH